MNAHQKVVLSVAAVDALLLGAFPPFASRSLNLADPLSFDGFFPFFSISSRHAIHRELLIVEMLFLAANTVVAWLATSKGPSMARTERGLAIFGAANLALLFAFPPFESYSPALRHSVPSFDSFYFFLGGNHGHIYAPMLSLEGLFVAANLLSLWLLFGNIRRPAKPGPKPPAGARG